MKLSKDQAAKLLAKIDNYEKRKTDTIFDDFYRSDLDVFRKLIEEAIEEEEPDRPPQKYKVGERVKVCGWGGTDYGKVLAIKWIYHPRMYEYVWGYSVDYEGKGPGLAFTFVPQGYLRKIDAEGNEVHEET